MNRKFLWVGLGLLVLVGVVVAAYIAPKSNSFRGTLYDPALPAPDFALTRDGESILRLSEMKGRIVLLFFGYTSCPDVCPTTLSEMRRVMEALGTDAARVQVLFVTVDPERDTPQKLKEYVSLFNPAFIGLSASQEIMDEVWGAYGVYREVVQMPNSATGYLVNHTARVYLVDLDGNLRLSYGFGTPTDDILHDLRILLD